MLDRRDLQVISGDKTSSGGDKKTAAKSVDEAQITSHPGQIDARFKIHLASGHWLDFPFTSYVDIPDGMPKDFLPTFRRRTLDPLLETAGVKDVRLSYDSNKGVIKIHFASETERENFLIAHNAPDDETITCTFEINEEHDLNRLDIMSDFLIATNEINSSTPVILLNQPEKSATLQAAFHVTAFCKDDYFTWWKTLPEKAIKQVVLKSYTPQPE